jgi:hypothetical protein
MDHGKILKRALETTWRYRVLWVFGILIALVTPRGGGNGGGGNISIPGNGDMGRFGLVPELPPIPPQAVSSIIAVGVAVAVGLGCMILLMVVVTTVLRYLSQTALIRLVDHHEETGERQGVRQGFRLGWSRSALHLFLIDLLIGVPTAVVFILLFLLTLSPLVLWVTGSQIAGIMGTVAAVGLVLMVVLLLIIVTTVLTLLTHFFQRACVLQQLGVFVSIGQGYGLVRRHLKDVAIMWLIMIGVGLAWLLIMVPLMILFVLLALALGGVPALMIGGLASLALKGALPWILAAAIALPIFILVTAIPAIFLSGLYEVFRSTVWTLTYRELGGLEGQLANDER